MTQIGAGGVVRLIQTLWDEGTVASLDDAELLGRFLGRDGLAEAAFAALVRRHAPMVLRVCRDVTGDPHDAEDAAQVTFLVLARKARSIRRGEALANWLFGTARRVAARAGARRGPPSPPRAAIRRDEPLCGASRTRPADGPGSEWAGLYAELDRCPTLPGADHPVRPGGPDARPGRHSHRLSVADPPDPAVPRARPAATAIGPAWPVAGGRTRGAFAHAEAGPAAVSASWASATTAAAMGLTTGPCRGHRRSPGRQPAFPRSHPGHVLLSTEVARGVPRHRRARRGPDLGLGPDRAWGRGAEDRRRTLPYPARAGPVGSSRRLVPRRNGPQGAKPAPPAPMTTPITVRGRATDGEGKPVAGATIYLVSTNGDGCPARHDDHRPRRLVHSSATLGCPSRSQGDDAPLAGDVPGLRHGPGPRVRLARHAVLSAPPPAGRLEGCGRRLHPLRRATRRSWTCASRPPRRSADGSWTRPAGRWPARRSGSASCDYLDTKGKESHHNFREFWAICAAPAALTTTTTGPDGRFRLEGLPKEAGFWVHRRASGLRLAGPLRRDDGPADDRVRLSRSSRSPRTEAAAGRDGRAEDHPARDPADRRPDGLRRLGAAGTEGQGLRGQRVGRDVRLRHHRRRRQAPAPPAARRVRGPGRPDGGRRGVRSAPGRRSRWTSSPPSSRSKSASNPGCVLILEVVDAKTGKGIPGVGFRLRAGRQPGSRVRRSRAGRATSTTPGPTPTAGSAPWSSRGNGSTRWDTSPSPPAIASSSRRSGSPCPRAAR